MMAYQRPTSSPTRHRSGTVATLQDHILLPLDTQDALDHTTETDTPDLESHEGHHTESAAKTVAQSLKEEPFEAGTSFSLWSSSHMRNQKKLTPQETAQLWEHYRKNPHNSRIRDKVILAYLHLVRYVVSRLPLTLPTGVSVDDLISFGTMGLMKAVERFEPERGLKFESYAVTRIRGSIIDHLRVQDWIPRGVRKRTKDLTEAITLLEKELGRSPSEDELAAHLKVTKARVQQMMSESQSFVLSLDETYADDGSGSSLSVMDTVEDQSRLTPDEEILHVELQQRLIESINTLPEREKLLIALYYHENLTLKEIGEIIQVSESRVCQLHAQAISRLRNKLRQLV
ncbi:MAG: sigma-70 family RNA polymerase sigma factor [Vampirovibrionales bacterium]